jgi:hypothetical protein
MSLRRISPVRWRFSYWRVRAADNDLWRQRVAGLAASARVSQAVTAKLVLNDALQCPRKTPLVPAGSEGRLIHIRLRG